MILKYRFTIRKKFLKMQSLEALGDWCASANIVIIGGGVSLDQCDHEITQLAADKENTVFFLADIVSEKFIRLYPGARVLVFSVENRYHHFLKLLRGQKIAIYTKANERNRPRLGAKAPNRNTYFRFHFDFDNAENGPSMLLKSAGTVIGPAVYWALYLSLLYNNKVENIYLLGLDFYYLENQMYNRFCSSSLLRTYWQNRETSEWIRVLKKTSHIETQGPYVLRTSAEFKKTMENLEILIRNSKTGANLYDFSPLGIGRGGSPVIKIGQGSDTRTGEIVKKIIPKKIKDQIFAT